MSGGIFNRFNWLFFILLYMRLKTQWFQAKSIVCNSLTNHECVSNHSITKDLMDSFCPVCLATSIIWDIVSECSVLIIRLFNSIDKWSYAPWSMETIQSKLLMFDMWKLSLERYSEIGLLYSIKSSVGHFTQMYLPHSSQHSGSRKTSHPFYVHRFLLYAFPFLKAIPYLVCRFFQTNTITGFMEKWIKMRL